MLRLGFISLLAIVATAFAAVALENENLLVSVPPGYKIDFQTKKDAMVMTAETVNDWTEMLTVQIFLGTKNVTPRDFMTKVANGWKNSCEKWTSHVVAEAPENGYAAMVWMLTCPLNKQTGKPEYTWFKAIAGRDSFYVVQKAFKFEPNNDHLVQWMRYLRSVAVCDTRLPDRPCPAATKP